MATVSPLCWLVPKGIALLSLYRDLEVVQRLQLNRRLLLRGCVVQYLSLLTHLWLLLASFAFHSACGLDYLCAFWALFSFFMAAWVVSP
ncbi:Uncharacterized protein TCM_038329 [Theobroma cacao]|uniref:Uncharacterized protein n=1 Tax=Theobroma cacao TaxID=3641 RepID=A0A061GW87_THECC|nr:Uncharacterized protein TCM_038329 [Theobroma cacao]